MKKNRLLFLLPLIASFVLTSCDMLSNLNFNGPRKRSSQEDSEVEDDYDDSSDNKELDKTSSRSSYHQHNYGEWVLIQAPTCTSPGAEERTCACGEKETRHIAATGHEFVEISPEDDTETNPAHKAKAPTCTEKGTKVEVCTRCQYRRESYIPAYGHNWGELVYTIEPTCTSSGMGVRECQNCGATESEYVPSLGHTWGEWDVMSDATCTVAGSRKHTCTVCGAYEQQQIPALGHQYDENRANWTVEPTCTEEGVGYVRCSRCSEQVMVTKPAYGHTLSLIDYHSPQSGLADTRVYFCSRCGKTTLNFNASAVTNDSKKTLVEEWNDGSEIGYRFWGRPIGNAVALDDNGSANSNEHTPIFDPNEKGSFFEIVFNLSAQQAAALGQCMLYCDAKPADYMNQSSLDFWASRDGATEWTPGYYLEGDKYGQLITDYRYRLYVDNQPVDFDPGIKAPVPSGNPRGEYVMPYIFNLHTGTNKFSLHMAGGYRSLFYNFTFRPLENPHTHTFGAWGSDNDYHWRVCTSENCFAAEGTLYNKNAHTWGEQYDVIPSTCTTQGSYKVKCTVCNYEKTVTIKEVAHSWVGGEVTVEGSQGRQTLTCSVCNSTEEVTGALYSSFLFGDAIQNGTTLDGVKFRKNTTYSFVVFNVPTSGIYTLSLTMKGSSSGGSRVMNGPSNTGQGFALDANGVPGVFYGDGKTYAEFLGEDQTVWVEVVFGEVTLLEGTNIINITTNNGDYRLSMKADANMTLTPKA